MTQILYINIFLKKISRIFLFWNKMIFYSIIYRYRKLYKILYLFEYNFIYDIKINLYQYFSACQITIDEQRKR